MFENGVDGFAANPQDDDEAVIAAIAQAKQNAALGARAGAAATLAQPEALGDGAFDYRSSKPALTAHERVDILRRLDEAIRAQNPDLVDAIVALNGFASEKALVTADGASTYSDVPRSNLAVTMSLQANDGIVELRDMRGGFGEIQDQDFDPASLLDWLDELYQELRRKAEGGQCEAGEHDVVLDSDLAGILAHEAIGHTCEGDLVLAGSVAGDNLGETVASEKITLGDYAGRGPDGKSTFAIHVDDEGTLCRDVAIIENGVLRNFLHSRQTAGELGGAAAGMRAPSPSRTSRSCACATPRSSAARTGSPI